MNNSIYDEYMRNVLGYQPMNTYNMNYDSWEMSDMNAINNIQVHELESCYPEIYRIVYPMIQKACTQNTKTVTQELIDSMANEIYSVLEDRGMEENRNKDIKSTKSTETLENRQLMQRNTGLNDLIRILLIRELLGKSGFPGQGGRPPRLRPPRPPMRPPMGPPPRPQPRPGMGTYNRFDQYEVLYEY